MQRVRNEGTSGFGHVDLREIGERGRVRSSRPTLIENPGMGPRFLPQLDGADAGRRDEDEALAQRLRTRLGKTKGDDVSAEDAKYMVNALRRAPDIGERTVRLLLSMLEHAHIEDVSLWGDMFLAVAKRCSALDELLPPERVVTIIHELADKLDKYKKLNDEGVEKLLAVGTMRGVPNIRTRRALESIRRLHPLTKSADRLMKTRLAEIPLAPPKPWTFFIYMASENNLESYAINDINDMEKTFAKIAPFANVVVLADGGLVNDEDKSLGPQPANNWSSKSRLILIEEADGQGQVMSRTVPVPHDSPLGELLQKGKGELNLGSPDTLKAAIDFVQKGMPADHMFFSTWSHGVAWKGAAEDGHDLIRPHELAQVFEGLDRVPDVMGYDACLMANREHGALLQNLGVGWLVGSEELLDATGWGYHRVFEGLAQTEQRDGKLTPQSLSHTIVDAAHGTTLSAIELDRMPKIDAGLDKLADVLLAAGGRTNEAIQTLIEALPRYGSYGVDASEEDKKLGDENVVDIIHMCLELEKAFPNSDIATAAEKLRTDTDAATHHKNMPSVSYPGIEDYSYGLTVYLPRTAEDFAKNYLGKGAVWKGSTPKWVELIKQKIPAAE